VLRSLSKGYCCGGLRAGYAVCSAPVAAEVRAAAAPLGVSELGLAAAVALLRRGDVFGALRRRVAEIKPAAVDLLAAAGFEVRPGDPRLPWLLVRAAGSPGGAGAVGGADTVGGAGFGPVASAAALATRRLAGRPLSRVDGKPTGWVRLSVPLAAGREAAFRAALAVLAPADDCGARD
jgi:hypothetical protein